MGQAVDAAAFVRELAEAWGATEAVVSRQAAAAAPGFLTVLQRASIGVLPPGSPEGVADAPLGVSLGRLAVAETASVLLAEPDLADRAVGMLTAAHLILCPTEVLVATLDDGAPVLRALALQAGGAYATLVTGPSRTADIERVLTVGVQGAAAVAVIFVDELE